MDKKVKSVQPKTGKNHGLFGYRHLKMHKIRDKKWTPNDKFGQYLGLISLHEKDETLASLKRKADVEKKVRKLHNLRKENKNDRQRLKIAIYGDIQRVKNILQDHKDLQRLCSNLPPHTMIDNMDQRTFVKRKELDRLICKRKELTQRYEASLLDMASLQDRIKYLDVLGFKDEQQSKNLRMQLKNTETRVRAVKNLNKAYKQIINTMTHDSMYMDPVLKALAEDITEQQFFIDTTIRLGLPALQNFQQLNRDFINLEQKTRQDIRARMETLRMYYEKIQHNNRTIKELVRTDSDFTIYPKRYDRETTSILALQQQLDPIEKDMKIIQKVTSCDNPEDVYPRMKELNTNEKTIVHNIAAKELKRESKKKQHNHANVIHQTLVHNLTDAEVEKVNEIRTIESNIQETQRKKDKVKVVIKEKDQLIEQLSAIFQHIADVLRHVGAEQMAEKKSYSNIDLNLPLLKFAAFPTKVIQPRTYLEDPLKLLDVITDRVDQLMQIYPVDDSTTEVQMQAEKVYHDAVLKDFEAEQRAAGRETGDAPFLTAATLEDPNVLNRDRIKFLSKKFVEAHSKTDD